MSSIEIMALVFAVLIVIKILVVSFSPKSWFNTVKKIYKMPMFLVIVEAILAGIVFYYLLMELTIVQIASAVLLGALLTGLSFAAYAKETLEWGNKILKSKTLWDKAWLPLLIWLVFALWVLKELFM